MGRACPAVVAQHAADLGGYVAWELLDVADAVPQRIVALRDSRIVASHVTKALRVRVCHPSVKLHPGPVLAVPDVVELLVAGSLSNCLAIGHRNTVGPLHVPEVFDLKE